MEVYKYKNAIDILIENIDEIKGEYQTNKYYYEDIPYVFYESVFERFIVSEMINKNTESIKRIFRFIEEVLDNGDREIKDLIEVAVIESLLLERNLEVLIKENEKYFGELTKKSISKFYSN